MGQACVTGCTCKRHTRLRKKCVPGCKCNRHIVPDSRRRKISNTMKNVKKTDEHSDNVSIALTGRKLSPEHVDKIRTHGLSKDKNYNRYKSMMDRCYNEENMNYHLYGGRGIKVHVEWHDIKLFCKWLDDNLGPCPEGYSMDRIDNDKGYEPGNLRWASKSTQNRNRSKYIRVW